MVDANPYQSPVPVDDRVESLDLHGRQLRGSFLFRELELTGQVRGRLCYTGWWFVQRVYLDDRLLWWKVSWFTLQSIIDFPIPDRDGATCEGRIQIDFAPGLRMRRFQLQINGQLYYDEQA